MIYGWPAATRGPEPWCRRWVRTSS